MPDYAVGTAIGHGHPDHASDGGVGGGHGQLEERREQEPDPGGVHDAHVAVHEDARVVLEALDLREGGKGKGKRNNVCKYIIRVTRRLG